MAKTHLTLRHVLFGFMGLIIGAGAVWLGFALTLAPSEEDFRVRASGHYAQQMSHYGVGRLASFRDCHLFDPDPFERLRGINWVAECTTSSKGTGYVYRVQLDNWARHRGEEFRVLAP